jgi:hypothetical protein
MALGIRRVLPGGSEILSECNEDNIWISVIRRVSLTIAKAVGRQLSTRLPWGEGLTPY